MNWIYHERKARVIYLLTTDLQAVVYWTTNNLLARVCFDFNKQETTRRQVHPSDFFSFLPLHEEILPTTINGVYMYLASFYADVVLTMLVDGWSCNTLKDSLQCKVMYFTHRKVKCEQVHLNGDLPAGGNNHDSL